MNVLDLFAGGGGGCLGGKLLGWKSIGYVEWDEGAQGILRARIADGCLEDAPIWDDAQSFTRSNNAVRRYIRALRGKVGITAGFPCQPFSCAGKGLGVNDPRNMWPATKRIIGEVRPIVALLENVSALITSGYFGTILGDLDEIGYDATWGIFSAAGVGLPHLRKRVWILAYPSGERVQRWRESRKLACASR